MNNLRALLDFWWLAPLAGAGLLAYRFLGWRGLLAVATLGVAGGLYTRGRTDERAKAEQTLREARSRAIEQRAKVNEDVAKMDPDAKRDGLSRWMRDDE